MTDRFAITNKSLIYRTGCCRAVERGMALLLQFHVYTDLCDVYGGSTVEALERTRLAENLEKEYFSLQTPYPK